MLLRWIISVSVVLTASLVNTARNHQLVTLDEKDDESKISNKRRRDFSEAATTFDIRIDERHLDASEAASRSMHTSSALIHSSKSQHHRRLSDTGLQLQLPLDQQYQDPRTVTLRNNNNPQPPSNPTYKVNPLIKPNGYPWNRWAAPSDGSYYPLNTQKVVSILARLGKGENELGTLHPKEYTSNNSLLTPDTIRLHGSVQVFLIRNGTVLRSKGVTGAFVSVVQNAIDLSKQYVDMEPSLKLLTRGDFPLIYDSNDYPWCGDDLVPIFRLNAIKSNSCQHSWPVLSLTYFNDANIQLLESPYQWDKLMTRWDEMYPWSSKLQKVVWRGRMTGYTHQDGERPRKKLVDYAKGYTDIMDIEESKKSNVIDQDDFQKYMAVLDIDGNAWSARFAKLLCYNSVVIKVGHLHHFVLAQL
jgi:hypothetical protein